MTLESKQTKIVYLPDGAQKRYSVSFPLFSPHDVACVYVDAAGHESAITNFSVQGYGTEGGVYVVFATPPPAGGSLVIMRHTRQVQESAYPEGGKFPSTVVERDFDRIVGMIQELFEIIARCLKVNVSEESSPESAEDLYARIAAALATAERAVEEAAAAAQGAQTAAGAAAGAQQIAQGAADSADAARNAAQDAADAAAAVLAELTGLSVKVMLVDCFEPPSGDYDPATGVLTFRLPDCGGTGGVTLSDVLDGSRTAAEGVGASEWAVGQAVAGATAAGEAAAAADAKAAAAGNAAAAADAKAATALNTANAANSAIAALGGQIKAYGYIDATGAILSHRGLVSCTRTEGGVYSVTSSEIKMNSIILTSTNGVGGTYGYSSLEMSNLRTVGNCMIRTGYPWSTATDDKFSIVILNP